MGGLLVVFYGIVVHAFHDIFNGIFWDEDFVEFFNGMFVYGSSDSNHDNDKGLLSDHYFGVWLVVGHSCGVCVQWLLRGICHGSW